MARDTNFKQMNELQLQVLYNASLTHTNRHAQIDTHKQTHTHTPTLGNSLFG